MSREYPDWVDPWKAAEGRRTYSGSMPLSRMNRLLPLLHDPGGEAWFRATFAHDAQRQVTIGIEVSGQLTLLCQSSLEPYAQPVARSSLLGVIENLAEESLLPADYEPVLVEDGRLALVQIVEDELLLGLPEVPRNPQLDAVGQGELTHRGSTRREFAGPAGQGTIGSGGKAAGENRQRPFAGLAEQMKKHSSQSGTGGEGRK